MKKYLIATSLIITLIISAVFAFNWPVQDISANNIQSYFGQHRGTSISTSFIFEEPGEIKTIGEGKLLIYMMEDINENLFPSTLGNSVIISHNDDIASVYGNLEKSSIEQYITTKTAFSVDEVIGHTGNSGFQVKRSNLEFQIYDSKKGSAINPKVFMPRTNNELPLTISGVAVQNKNGDFFTLSENKVLESGTYKVYQKRNEIACPYKTRLTINGVEIDSITFDTIHEDNSKVYINGKKKYLGTSVYPDENLQLLGEAVLTPGKISLGLEVENFLGEKKNTSYLLTIN